MWRKYDAISLATPEAFAENQSRVWQFYHYRREVVLKAAPNPGHYALACLAIPSIRHKLAPNSEFTHVTQNIDGLCERSLDEMVAAFGNLEQPAELIEMHGRLFDVICSVDECNFRERNYKSPICAALAGTEKIVEKGGPEPVIRHADLPHCPDCGQLSRPGVVWFGEEPHRMDDIFELADEADLCIIVGTSAVVQPAASVGARVKRHGGQVAVFNIERSKNSDKADFLFFGPCETRLGEVLGIDEVV